MIELTGRISTPGQLRGVVTPETQLTGKLHNRTIMLSAMFPKAVSFVRNGNTITETSTSGDGLSTFNSTITLDEFGSPVLIRDISGKMDIEITYDANGYATSIITNGEPCPVKWGGFNG